MRITPAVAKFAAGSARIELGDTHVFCTASLSDGVPGWLRGSGRGWLTAEYSMLPGATPTRTAREAVRGKQSGRTMEIQRLIGRSLRGVMDMGIIGERTIAVDCDVLQADGGTRTASITGAYVAVYQVALKIKDLLGLHELPLFDSVAAVSAGIVDGEARLDLDYEEDSAAEVDLNAGDHRRRPPRRGAGHRRGGAVLARGARRHARPRDRRRGRPGGRPGRRVRGAGTGLMRFVLATGNRHKAAEFAAILAPCRVDVMPAGVELPPEGVESFAENALGKAEALARAVEGDPALLRQLGLRPDEEVLFLADDSGLEVEALGWAPGVTSARYAGVDGPGADRANYERLLGEMSGLAGPLARRARFVCSVVAVAPDMTHYARNGTLVGRHRRGAAR